MDYDPIPPFLRAKLPGYVPPVRPPKKDPYDEFTNSRKLDVALKEDIVDNFRIYVKARSIAKGLGTEIHPDPKYELLLRTPDIPNLARSKTDSSFLPLVMQSIFQRPHSGPSSKKTSSRLKTIFRQAHDNIKIQMEHNMASLSGSCKVQYEEKKNQLLSTMTAPPHEITNFVDAFYELKELVDQIPLGQIPEHTRRPEAVELRIKQILEFKTNYKEIPKMNLKAWWAGDLAVLVVSGTSYVLPINVLPELWNKAADHLSVLLFSWLSSSTYIEADAYEITVDFLKALHKRHIAYPASFFSVAGAIEALCTAILIERHDTWKDGPNLEFITATLEDIRKSCSDVKDPPVDKEHEIIQLMMRSTSPLMAELSCLAKMSGHPITSTRAGMEKLHERTTRPRVIKTEAVAYTCQSLKKEFIKEYFATNGHYPPKIELSPTVSPRIAAAFNMNKDIDDPSLNHFGQYTTEDFVEIKIHAFEELDTLENILPYLKDTASSVTQSKVWNTYIKQLRKHSPHDVKEEKLLLMYILGSPEELDHVGFIQEFEKHQGDIERFMEQFAIRLVPKEKELKPVARLFGCMTYKGRATTQVVLRFMQRYLRRYCSSQALVLTELELAKKLYAFSKKKTLGGGMRAFTICLDAEGWNNAFTKETVEPPMHEVIDAMLGSVLPSTLHEAFEYTIFYAKEKGRVIYYHGQNGGIEGLLQGTWMVVYIHQLRYALRDCRHHYDILIKGDDVRVRFEIPPSDIPPGQEPQVLSHWRKKAINGLAEFGHTIKTLDSYYSENVLVFSKKIFVQDVALPSSFRQIQKTYGANNAFMFTTDDSVGAAFSNAHSAAGYGVNVLAPYIVALFWSLIHILGEAPYQNLTHLQLQALLLTPSALGGFPIIYLHNMYVRAESDLVSAFGGIVLFALRYYPPLGMLLEKVGNYKMASKSCLNLLVEDPYSLPRAGHTSPNATLRSKLKDILRRKARNPAVKALFNSEVEHFKRCFLAAVDSGDRLDPKLINAVYECTICAVQEKFLQKFTSAKTIIQHIYSMQNGGASIRSLCKRLLYERTERDKQIAAIVTTFSGTRVGVYASDFECPTRYAEELRNVGWGKPVDGITYPPPQHQVYIFRDSETLQPDVGKCFIYSVESGSMISPHLPSVHFWQTPGDAFLGHHTPSGTIAAPLEMDNPDVVVGNIRKLLMLSTMAILDSQENKPEGSFTFYDIILYLLAQYTKLPLSELEELTNKRKSGTRTHHLGARGFRIGILPNMTKNLLSHVRGQVNTYSDLRANSKNYRINFLHLYVHISVLLCFNWFLPNAEMNVGVYKATIPPCEDCFTEILEENTYMTDREIFSCVPDLSDDYGTLIANANQLIKQAMEDDSRERDVREVYRVSEQTERESCLVVAGEFFSATLLNFSRMTLGYTVIRPTVERLQDMMMMKGRRGGGRDITGSELVKLPPNIIIDYIREAVIDYTFSYKTLDKMKEIHACYATMDPRILPWATCVNQLLRHGKLQAVIAECCSQVGLPFNSGANSCRDYGAACSFLGKHLSTRGIDKIRVSDAVICVAEYVKSSTLHLLIGRRRTARLLWYVTTYPMDLILQMSGGYGEWGTHEETVLTILVLALFPSWSVEDIRVYFATTPSNQEIEMVGEVYSDWLPDEAAIAKRVPPEYVMLLQKWVEGSDWSWETLKGYILDHEEGFFVLFFEENKYRDKLDTAVTVIFRDLASCYQEVRELDTPEDLDDYCGKEEPGHVVTRSPARRVKLVGTPGIEKVWEIKTGLMDWGPEAEEPAADDYRGVHLDFTHLGRAYGFTTSAWVKTARIMEALGILVGWKKSPLNIACLGDGDGGDSRWIADHFQSSIVVWDSLNTDVVSYVSNPLALRVRQSWKGVLGTHPRVRCRTQTLEGGDLTKPHIRNLIKKEVSHYNIVKSDVSLPFGPERASVAKELWAGVLEIWVEAGDPASVMIQKVFSDIPETLAWIVGQARKYSKYCHLLTLTDSHCSHECYLVCQYPVNSYVAIDHHLSAPKHIRGVCYDVATHNQRIISDSRSSVSLREYASSVLPHPWTDVELPLKALTTIHEAGLDERFTEDIASTHIRLRAFTNTVIAQLHADGPEFADENLDRATLAHLMHVTNRVVFWESVLLVTARGRAFAPTMRGFINAETKERIVQQGNSKVESLTGSPRWRRLGGPFTLSDGATAPLEREGRNLPPPAPLEFRALFLAGVKLGMEILAALREKGEGNYIPPVRETVSAFEAWASL